MNTKRLITFLMIISFLVISILPAYAQETKEKTILTLVEIQELALKNNRNLKTLDLVLDQAEKLEYIYDNEYDKARANSIGNYQLSRPDMEQLAEVESAISNYEAIGFNENMDPTRDLPLAALLPLYSEADQRALFAHYMTLVLTQKMLTQKITGTEEIVEGQMSILKLLGVADSTSIVKQLREEKENAEYAIDDLKRIKQDAEKQIKQTVSMLVFAAIKLQDNINLLEKTYDQYLKMTSVERIKKSSGLASGTDVDNMAVKASNYGKQLKFARENLRILKGKINDFMGRDINNTLQIVKYNVNTVVIPQPSYEAVIDEIIKNTYEFYKLDREIEDLEDELDDIDGSNEKAIKKDEIEKTKLAKEEKEVEIKNEVKKLLANYHEKAKAYQLAQIKLESAAKEYEWEKIKYQSGLISKLMLTGSELKYLKALNESVAAGYDYELAKKEFELAREGVFLSEEYYNAKKQFEI
ncbi:MAG: hypothetical protein PWQ67_1950 [Clostridia bacterium]|nr:hypothetical protein [Clostridia bacterium]